VEGPDLRGGSARGRRLHAELLPEGEAGARAARVRSVRSPPDQDQGTVACPCTGSLFSRACRASAAVTRASSAMRGAAYVAMTLTHGFASEAAAVSHGSDEECVVFTSLPPPRNPANVSLENDISVLELLCLP